MIQQAMNAADEIQAQHGSDDLRKPGTIERLGAKYDAETLRLALEQIRLREKAAKKFSAPANWYWIEEALEQASPENVAAFHASLFPDGAAVADLTVGMGSDLVALAGRGPATGFELEPFRCAVAEFNLTSSGRQAELICADCLSQPVEAQMVFADPARRRDGSRSHSIEDFEPDPRELARVFSDRDLVVIRTSPLVDDEQLFSLGERIVFVSYRGKCIEALCLSGKDKGLVGQPGVFAFSVERGEYLPQTSVSGIVEDPLDYLLDLNPAAVRAGAGGAISELQLGTHPSRVTSNEPNGQGWSVAFRVERSGGFHERQVKQAIRDLGGFVEVVKAAGSGVDPVQLIKRLPHAGDRPLTMHIYPYGKRLRYALSSAPEATHDRSSPEDDEQRT